MNLEDKIKKRLTNYLGFDYTKLINEKIDYAYVFGGAIRDIIAGFKINDIDLLCLPESKHKVRDVLIKNGYKKIDLIGKDIMHMYSKSHLVFEPFNYIKIINNELRLVQIIVPTNNTSDGYETGLITNFHRVLGEVDMSNCAVHFSHNYGLRESYLGAVNHCKHHVFEILNTRMKTDRFEIRYNKFINRGWSKLDDKNSKQFNRAKKLENILGVAKTKYYLPPGIIQKVIKSYGDIDSFFII